MTSGHLVSFYQIPPKGFAWIFHLCLFKNVKNALMSRDEQCHEPAQDQFQLTLESSEHVKAREIPIRLNWMTIFHYEKLNLLNK